MGQTPGHTTILHVCRLTALFIVPRILAVEVDLGVGVGVVDGWMQIVCVITAIPAQLSHRGLIPGRGILAAAQPFHVQQTASEHLLIHAPASLVLLAALLPLAATQGHIMTTRALLSPARNSPTAFLPLAACVMLAILAQLLPLVIPLAHTTR